MKKLKKLQFLSIILFVGLCIYSCEDTIEQEGLETEETTQANTADEIDFKGLKVNHRFSTPVAELLIDDSTEDFKEKYNRIKRTVYSKNLGLSANKTQQVVDVSNEDLPSGAMIIEGVKMIADQFPYDLELSEENEKELEIIPSHLEHKDSLTVEEYEELNNIKEQDSIALSAYELSYQEEKEVKLSENMEMIKQDFPTLSDESIEENIDLIDEYYQKNMDYMTLEEVVVHEEEIENNLKQGGLQFSQKYSKVSSTPKEDAIELLIAIVNTKYVNLSSTEKCVFAKVTRKYGLVGMAIAAYAGKKARERANSYYSGLHDKLSRLDAFRHTYWNALMCKNYVTRSKVKQRRVDFAEFVAEALYDCGDVYDKPGESIDIDARAMDRRNDNVGRRIYDQNTSRKKIWRWYYLREPSYSRLRSIIKDKIHKSSDYIVKFHPEDDEVEGSVNYGAKYDYTSQEVVDIIDGIDDDRPVYFRKTIAAPYYTYSRYGPWYRRRYRKTTNYPVFHSKDPDLTYMRLSKQVSNDGSDR